MNEVQIKELFDAILWGKNPGQILNIDKHKINNYRNKTAPSLGTMMELLFKAGKIKVTANEPEGPTQ